MLATCWQHASNILATCWQRAGNMLATCWQHGGSKVTTCWQHIAFITENRDFLSKMSFPLSSPYSVLLGARLVAIRAQKLAV